MSASSTATDWGIPNKTLGRLPSICCNGRQLRDISAEALGALQQANDPPVLFARSGSMVAVIEDEKKRRVISNVTESALRGRLARAANFFKTDAKGYEYECSPPIDTVRDIQALEPSLWGFDALDGVVEAPILRPDGSILDQPGYDKTTLLYYAPDPSLRMPSIAERPAQVEIEQALKMINQAIDDFPFVDQANKTNAIAAMLSPIVKPAIDAPAPMALIDAPQAGT
jgi:putative DNA primase/helicase